MDENRIWKWNCQLRNQETIDFGKPIINDASLLQMDNGGVGTVVNIGNIVELVSNSFGCCRILSGTDSNQPVENRDKIFSKIIE